MNARRLLIGLFALLALLTLGAAMTFAQDPGGQGPGPGPGGQGPGGPNGQQGQGCCIDEPQMHAYQYGGMGFVNGRNGSRWDDDERGDMRGNRGEERGGVGFFTTLPPPVEGELSAESIAAMTGGLYDEQTALAIYDAIIAQFGEVTPFVNIRRAEAQHMAAWEFLFDRYGVPLPEAVQAPDVPAFASLADACQAAADAEIANFGLYDQMLETLAAYPDMVRVITSLRDASQYHHLPAFEQCAAR